MRLVRHLRHHISVSRQLRIKLRKVRIHVLREANLVVRLTDQRVLRYGTHRMKRLLGEPGPPVATLFRGTMQVEGHITNDGWQVVGANRCHIPFHIGLSDSSGSNLLTELVIRERLKKVLPTGIKPCLHGCLIGDIATELVLSFLLKPALFGVEPGKEIVRRFRRVQPHLGDNIVAEDFVRRIKHSLLVIVQVIGSDHAVHNLQPLTHLAFAASSDSTRHVGPRVIVSNLA